MARISRMTRKRLGELLLDEELVTDAQLAEALAIQKEDGRSLGEILAEMKFVSEEDIARAICRQYGLPFIDPARYKISDEAKAVFPYAAMRQYNFIPLDLFNESVVIVISSVFDSEVAGEVERICGRRLHIMVGTISSVRLLLDTEFKPEGDDEQLTGLGSMLLGEEEAKSEEPER